MLRFDVLHRDLASGARLGRLETAHGAVDTPAYCPVATGAAVRGVTPDQVRATGTQMLLANAFLLDLRPGVDVVQHAGGVHRFMAWDGAVLTDSGGFQVFSLASSRTVDDDGVTFRSPVDGRLVRLTPESLMGIQNAVGADVAMVLDHCPSYPAEREEIAAAVRRSSAWAARCRAAHRRPEQAIFGIVQGGVHLDLRRESLEALLALDFPGYAIGGVSVGESSEEMHRVIAAVAPELPAARPRYLMGLGQPLDLFSGMLAGVDLFDCVVATRNARNATLFTRRGLLRLRNAALARELDPLDPGCGCYTCARFSRAYLRHLYMRKESLAGTLGTIHNLHFFQDLMRRARAAIRSGTLRELAAEYQAAFARDPGPDGSRRGP
jgi:queuine tRNA-ribosyltransferase